MSAVCFAAFVVPFLIGQFDLTKWYVLVLGLGWTVICGWLSMITADEGKL